MSDPAFIQKLNDCIRSVLAQYSDDQEAGLQDMQNFINNSTIFGSIVEKVRDFCMADTKSLRVKTREEEKEVISNLITARQMPTKLPKKNSK